MTVDLSPRDRAMLAGDHGEAARMAMAIMVRMADVMGAPSLMDVSQAHIDGCGLLSDPGVEFAERLATAGGRVCIPTTLNMGPLDLQNWEALGVDRTFAEKAIRQGKAYTDLGCMPTWTCAPYQSYLTPRFGQQLVWGESNAICYANSVIGARTERYGDYMDICGALTGRVPRCGLHLTDNRRGQILIRLEGFEPDMMTDDTFFAVLGHRIGTLAADKIPVIEGFPASPTDDQFKAFCAAVASSGAVALFHAVGVTPEAPTREAAFQGGMPSETIVLTPEDWQASRADFFTAQAGDPLDLVVLGCPHFSFAEFRRLAGLIQQSGAAAKHPDTDFQVITSRTSNALFQSSPYRAVLEKFGVTIILDTCPFHSPIVPSRTRVIMTNSGKCAYYAPGELDVTVAFGTMAECVRSAVAGRVCVGEGE